MKSRPFVGALALFIATTAVASSPKAKPKIVDLGGRKLWMQSAGKGGPTVVLEAGGGDDHHPWDGIFGQIAHFSSVVSYDRAGYGKSDPDPATSSYERRAADLHALLQKSGSPGPYILVGHSYGGALIRAFAKLYRDEVAGLVFVDPMTEGIFSAIPPDQLKEVLAQEERRSAGGPAGQKTEFAYLKDEALQGFPALRGFGPPPDVPTVLLIAGSDRPPGWAKAVLDTYQPWIFTDREAGLRYLSASRHYIMADDPEAVVEAIRRVVFPDVGLALQRTIDAQGVSKAIEQYRQMKRRWPADRFRENILNTLGYRRLQAKDVPGAVALFKLNVEMYPMAFNTYDSLGEAMQASGDREGAIRNFRRSLELNPDNKHADEMLNKIKSGGG